MAVIRTVLGDVPAEDAGVVLTHEHTLIFWPGADIDHRAAFDHDDVVAGLSEEFKLGTDLFGLRTLVDCTTTEMGRHPNMMREASRRSGESWKVELEARAWNGVDHDDPMVPLRRDDYVQLTVSRFF